jgi:hypothetical protein
MKKAFKLSSLLLVSVVLFQLACSDDDVPPVDNTPDPTGNWSLTLATLVDGNASTPEEADPLVIANLAAIGMPDEPIPVGDYERTSALVGGALAGTACDIPTNALTFFIELRADNRLLFHCPAEDNIVDDVLNVWVVAEDIDNPGSYSVTLKVVVAGTALPITIVNFEISADGKTFTGRALGYPMVKDLAFDIGEDMNPGGDANLNIQFISTDMVFGLEE